jgi:hypothetical protein
LQSHMPELEKQFPEIAKTVTAFVQPVQPAAPAAALHGAQSKCQIAFRELQSAESEVSELEVTANELVAELRNKVKQLADAQLVLAEARTSYDNAAKVAHTEVQKHSKSDALNFVDNIIADLEPDKLEEVAKRMSEAAAAARIKERDAPQSPKGGTTTPRQDPPPAQSDAPMGIAQNVGDNKSEQKQWAEVIPDDQSAGTAPLLVATSSSANSLAPGSPVHPGVDLVAPSPATDVAKPSPPSPLGDSSLRQRDGSRSPRRASGPPPQEETDGNLEPPPKAAKQEGQDAAEARRATSRSSASSVRSRKSASQPASSPEHFAALATQFAQQLPTAKVQDAAGSKP